VDERARALLVAEEREAQRHAHAMYVDDRSVLNKWEEGVLDRILDWLGNVDAPVLDVGCGVGHLGRVAAARGRPLELVGFDLMAELLADAKTGYRALVQGDVHRLPLKDGSVGAMILSNTLHHVPDRPVALQELRRVLAPGGIVTCYDPRRVAPLEAIKRLARRQHEAFSSHHYAFGPTEYRTMLEDAGFEFERFVAVDPLGPLLATALDMVRAGTFVNRDRVAAMLVAVDRAIERRDRKGDLGLMLLAKARRTV
jgi:SAM-dependent methyltransferase